MKKKIGIALCAVILICIMPVLAGCRAIPSHVNWYLSYYLLDGEKYSVNSSIDPIKCVSSDAVLLSFDENGDFYFKSYDGTEYTGTYKCRDTLSCTKVTLKFPDGGKAKGWCAMNYFDAVWYSAEFTIFGVTYIFGDTEYSFDAEKYRSNIVKNLNDLAVSDEYESGSYKKATIENVGGNYVAKTQSNEYSLNETEYLYYCTYNESELNRGELREGNCIIYTRYSNCLIIYYPENAE